MAEVLASGTLIDIILALVVAEALGLWLWLRLTRRSALFGTLAANLAAGFCLLATVRLALAGAWWGWMALALTAALLSHLVDLWVRLSPAGPAPAPDPVTGAEKTRPLTPAKS